MRPLPNVTNPFAHYITFQFNHLIHLHQDKDHAEQDQLDTTGTANKNIVVDMSRRSSVLIRQKLADLGEGERHDAVVIVDGILHQKPVGLRLLVQDCCGKLFPENMNDCEAGAAEMRIK